MAQSRSKEAAMRLGAIKSSNTLLKLPVFMWQVYDYSDSDFELFKELMRTDKSVLGVRISFPQKAVKELEDYDGSLASAQAIFAVFESYKDRLEIKIKMKKDSRSQTSNVRPGAERLDAIRLKHSDDIN
jgi:hypothetical protein